jgi:YfiH family protein
MQLYFGNRSTAINPEAIKKNLPQAFSHDPALQQIKKELQLSHLLFLHQTHSSQGHVFSQESIRDYMPFGRDGDFLITSVLRVGLAVATADCLPIALYDCEKKVVAMVHAGWKGSVARVIINTAIQMQQLFASRTRDIKVFFGPHAGPCCYEIGSELLTALPTRYHHAIEHRADRLFLNVALINRLQLHSIGIENIDDSYSQCTMHNPELCSYRRDNKSPLRQMSVISL